MDSSMPDLIKQSPPVDVTKPYDETTLEGKTVVITGGANGLGSHFVRKWASAGAHIVIGDVDDKAGEAFVAELRTTYSKSTFVYQHCDVVDWDSQVALFETAVKESPNGGIDIVVPDAGIVEPGDARQFDSPQLVNGKLPKPSTKTLDVNITGVTYTTHLALYHLPKNGKVDRCILLLGSVASLVPLPSQTHYAMSKHAVAGLFRTIRGTAGINHGIRVNMICPYFVKNSHMFPPAAEAFGLSGTAGPATASDVVDAATRLVADESIAGRALVIGPRLQSSTVPEVESADPRMVVTDEEGGGEGRAVWECYADDYEQLEGFMKRYLILLNYITTVRGWVGLVFDLVRIAMRK